MAITDKYPVKSREVGIVTYYARITEDGSGTPLVEFSSGISVDAVNAAVSFDLAFDLQDTPDDVAGANVAVNLLTGAGARLVYWDVKSQDPVADPDTYAIVAGADNTIRILPVGTGAGDGGLTAGAVVYCTFVFDTRTSDNFS